MNKTQNRKLLVVLAHPDDETFGMGGTLALYAQQGVEVHLVCATRGDSGRGGAGTAARLRFHRGAARA